VKLILSSAAAADTERLRAFLANTNPTAAQRAVRYFRAIQSLESLVDRGRPSDIAGARELTVPFGRSAHVLRYVYDAQSDA
jgi:plasmid stabilization system protein ParE